MMAGSVRASLQQGKQQSSVRWEDDLLVDDISANVLSKKGAVRPGSVLKPRVAHNFEPGQHAKRRTARRSEKVPLADAEPVLSEHDDQSPPWSLKKVVPNAIKDATFQRLYDDSKAQKDRRLLTQRVAEVEHERVMKSTAKPQTKTEDSLESPPVGLHERAVKQQQDRIVAEGNYIQEKMKKQRAATPTINQSNGVKTSAKQRCKNLHYDGKLREIKRASSQDFAQQSVSHSLADGDQSFQGEALVQKLHRSKSQQDQHCSRLHKEHAENQRRVRDRRCESERDFQSQNLQTSGSSHQSESEPRMNCARFERLHRDGHFRDQVRASLVEMARNHEQKLSYLHNPCAGKSVTPAEMEENSERLAGNHSVALKKTQCALLNALGKSAVTVDSAKKKKETERWREKELQAFDDAMGLDKARLGKVLYTHREATLSAVSQADSCKILLNARQLSQKLAKNSRKSSRQKPQDDVDDHAEEDVIDADQLEIAFKPSWRSSVKTVVNVASMCKQLRHSIGILGDSDNHDSDQEEPQDGEIGKLVLEEPDDYVSHVLDKLLTTWDDDPGVDAPELSTNELASSLRGVVQFDDVNGSDDVAGKTIEDDFHKKESAQGNDIKLIAMEARGARSFYDHIKQDVTKTAGGGVDSSRPVPISELRRGCLGQKINLVEGGLCISTIEKVQAIAKSSWATKKRRFELVRRSDVASRIQAVWRTYKWRQEMRRRVMAAKAAELESASANVATTKIMGKDFDVLQLLDIFTEVYTDDQREDRFRAAKKIQQALRIIWSFRKECANEFLREGYEVEHCHDSNQKARLEHLIKVAWFGLVHELAKMVNGRGNGEESEAQASDGDAELDILDLVDRCCICNNKFDEDDQFCMQCGARRPSRFRPFVLNSHGREEPRYDNPPEPIRRRSFGIGAEDLMQSNSFTGFVNEGVFAGTEHIQRQADRWKSREKAIKRVLRKHHIYGDKAAPAERAQNVDQQTERALVKLYYAVEEIQIQSDYESSSQMAAFSIMFSGHKSNDGNSRWSLNQFEAILASLNLGFSKEFIHYVSVDLRITDDAGNIMKDELIEVMNDAFASHRAKEEAEKMLRPSFIEKVEGDGKKGSKVRAGPRQTTMDVPSEKKREASKNLRLPGKNDRGKASDRQRESSYITR